MAQANNETYEEACTHLKQQYDGYHFSENCEDIYNPFSLFNAFAQKKYVIETALMKVAGTAVSQ